MKEDIKPMWEDPENKEVDLLVGGLKKKMLILFGKTYALFMSSSFTELEEYGLNGISISPKKNTNIIKLWIKKITEEELKNISLPEECIFKNELKSYLKDINFKFFYFLFI